MVRKEKKVRNTKELRKLLIACLTWIAVIFMVLFTVGCSETKSNSDTKEVEQVITKPDYYIEVNSFDMELLFYTGDMFVAKYEGIIYPIKGSGINQVGHIRYSDASCTEAVWIGSIGSIRTFSNLGGVAVGYSQLNGKMLVSESLNDEGFVYAYVENNGECLLDRGNINGYSSHYKLTQIDKPGFIQASQNSLVFSGLKITE
jgi:hypothetical protein